MGMVQKQLAKRKVKKLTADVLFTTSAEPQIVLDRRDEIASADLPPTKWRVFRYQGLPNVVVEPSGSGVTITYVVHFTNKKNPSKTKQEVSYQINLQPHPRGVAMTTPYVGVTQGEDFPDAKHYQAMQELVLRILSEADPSTRAVLATESMV